MRGPLGPGESVYVFKELRWGFTLISRGGQDDGQVEGLADSSMGQRLVVIKSRIPISGVLVETFLDINHEKKLQMSVYWGSNWWEVAYSIVLVETLILVRGLLGKSRSRQQARGEDRGELHGDGVERLAWEY